MKDSYNDYKKELQGEYKEKFDKIDKYCTKSMENYSEQYREEKMSEILDTFLMAQQENKNIDEIIGNNLVAYCKNICKVDGVKQKLLNSFTLIRNIVITCLVLVLIPFDKILPISYISNNKVFLFNILFMSILVNTFYSIIDIMQEKNLLENNKYSKKIAILKALCIFILVVAPGFFNFNILISKDLVIGSSLLVIILYDLLIKDNTPENNKQSIKDMIIITKRKFENVNKKCIKANKEAKVFSKFIQEERKDAEVFYISCLVIMASIVIFLGIWLINTLNSTNVSKIMVLVYVAYRVCRRVIRIIKIRLKFLEKIDKENIDINDLEKLIK